MPESKDLTLQTPWGKLNIRVAFLVFRAGKILLQQHDAHDYWFMPGGRVAFGETSEETVIREIGEELHCAPDSLELAGVVENFFVSERRDFHELMVFYRAALPEPLAVPKTDTNGTPITSSWFSSDDLRETDLKPAFLKERLFSFAAGFQHVTHRDSKKT